MFRYVILLLFCVQRLYGYTIDITDKHSSDKEEVISNLLLLQHDWQIDIRAYSSQNDTGNGFLFVRMQPEFIHHLVEHKNAIIISASTDKELVGYIILTDITEFFDLYMHTPIRTFECLVNQSVFEKYLDEHTVRYVEQIAVKRDQAHKGIGTNLLNKAKSMSPSGIVAAVLTKPVPNSASLDFFTKNQFIDMGTLNCMECPEWPAYQTQVLFWSSNAIKEKTSLVY